MNSELGAALLTLARNAIAEKLGCGRVTEPAQPEEFLRPGAVFVTLKSDGNLRGCIGSLAAWRPLRDDVTANACAAAFGDPRFKPLGANELSAVKLEVSLLSPTHPIAFSSEADAIAQLNPGIDGVVLEYGHHRGTFLPQVWEDLPEPHQFMAQLKRKAGLSPDFWSNDIRLSRYSVDKWKEA